MIGESAGTELEHLVGMTRTLIPTLTIVLSLLSASPPAHADDRDRIMQWRFDDFGRRPEKATRTKVVAHVGAGARGKDVVPAVGPRSGPEGPAMPELVALVHRPTVAGTDVATGEAAEGKPFAATYTARIVRTSDGPATDERDVRITATRTSRPSLDGRKVTAGPIRVISGLPVGTEVVVRDLGRSRRLVVDRQVPGMSPEVVKVIQKGTSLDRSVGPAHDMRADVKTWRRSVVTFRDVRRVRPDPRRAIRSRR